ncbi:E3 ubiquitin ligase family protein [Salinilacihabitans rarus]|uniref:E3 ubiquitin ligase family protein n=1 Tax=Salinilacihabitans rarus TaxID=2961596 RepID=UPI0020C89840|nr:E3 ubiquitin ligase family protein [Salinilacihabitans rarus]
MGLWSALGVIALVVGLTVAVARMDPDRIERVTSEVDLPAPLGRVAYGLWVVGLAVPFAFGASVEDTASGIGLALYSVGAFFLLVSVSTRDEYARFRAATKTTPDAVRPSADPDASPVALSGVPVPVEAPPTGPASGEAAVSVEWTLQKRGRLAHRTVWDTVAAGAEAVPFAFETDAVDLRIEPRPERSFETETAAASADPDEPLPPAFETLLDRRADLPDPNARDERLRVIEERLPADRPVTVVGTPRRAADGTVVIDGGPPAGAPSRAAPGAEAATDGAGAPAPVVVPGTVDRAERHLRRRVRWLGAASVALVIGGQAAAFAWSSASLPV